VEEVGTERVVRGEYGTIYTREDLERAVENCRSAGSFAVDTETDSVDPMQARLVGISLSCKPGEGVYIPTGHTYLGAPDQLSLEVVQEILGPLLADGSVGKIAQNLKFDLHVLRRHGMPVEGWQLDTMVAAFLLQSDRHSYKMDVLSEEYLGYAPIPYEQIAGKGARQITMNLIDVERVSTYAAEDADVTLRLALTLQPRLVTAGLQELYDTVDGPLLPMLARMEARGIGIDVEMLAAMSTEIDKLLSEHRLKIHQLADTEFNVDSPKQLREVLFDKLGFKPRRKTAKSKVASTDHQTLEELAEEHEIAQVLLAYRELAKLKGTYVDALPKLVNPETGRVHTSYHPTGAATGRLSSSDPNLQNIPVRTEAGRRIREAFVPRPGYRFLASDYSQVELRVLAHLCGDPDLISAFRAGEDIHRHTAASVAGVPLREVDDIMRQRAKAVNFGILYGMSSTRLAREQGMTREEASAFIEAYFDRFGAVRTYIETIRELAMSEGAVRTLFGRVRYFPQLHQGVHRGLREQALRAAVNTTIQGTAADLMKMAMLQVEDALQAAKSPARILLQVHDELMLEVPEDSLDETERIVRDAMEGVYKLAVPLKVDQKVGQNWAEVK
jgi:DNA polymerase-1